MDKEKSSPKGSRCEGASAVRQIYDSTADEVLQVLTIYRGHRKLTRHELSRMAHVTDRSVRLAIEQLREAGHTICADRSGGGYWIGTRKEYEAMQIADYRSRIASMNRKLKAFYGLPIEGQVRLP